MYPRSCCTTFLLPEARVSQYVACSENQQGQLLLSLGKDQTPSPTCLYVLLQYIAQKGFVTKIIEFWKALRLIAGILSARFYPSLSLWALGSWRGRKDNVHVLSPGLQLGPCSLVSVAGAFPSDSEWALLSASPPPGERSGLETPTDQPLTPRPSGSPRQVTWLL